MNFRDLPPLPLGESDFSALRGWNALYVDRTELIYSLAETGGMFFLARPRRFGKSLLVSTFESLFRHGLRDFRGLAIEHLWNDKTYTVVHLDFSLAQHFGTLEEFQEQFGLMLRLAAEEAGLTIPNVSGDPIDDFVTLLALRDCNSLVLLIDEYDAPFTAHFDNPALFAQIRDCLSWFYSAIKSYGGCLRFFFMTGITMMSRTGIFSSINIQNISLDPRYGTLLGFTEEDIENTFGPHLDFAAQTLGISRAEVMSRLLENYDGFTFDDEADTHVCSPWSVLNFLDGPHRGFWHYWFESGGNPMVLTKFLGDPALAEPSSFDRPVCLSLFDLSLSSFHDELSVELLWTQAGYLSIKENLGGCVLLGYPTREVALSMGNLYADRLLETDVQVAAGVPYLNRVMAEESVDVVVHALSRALHAIDEKRFPIKDEATCRAYLQVLLTCASLLPTVEKDYQAQERCEMEVTAGRRRWVLAFQVARNGADPQKLLDTALEQIRSRPSEETDDGKELIRVGLVFSPKERRFVVWQREDQ